MLNLCKFQKGSKSFTDTTLNQTLHHTMVRNETTIICFSLVWSDLVSIHVYVIEYGRHKLFKNHFSFYTLRKHQKIGVFREFLGDIEETSGTKC